MIEGDVEYRVIRRFAVPPVRCSLYLREEIPSGVADDFPVGTCVCGNGIRGSSWPESVNRLPKYSISEIQSRYSTEPWTSELQVRSLSGLPSFRQLKEQSVNPSPFMESESVVNEGRGAQLRELWQLVPTRATLHPRSSHGAEFLSR